MIPYTRTNGYVVTQEQVPALSKKVAELQRAYIAAKEDHTTTEAVVFRDTCPLVQDHVATSDGIVMITYDPTNIRGGPATLTCDIPAEGDASEGINAINEFLGITPTR